MKVKIGDICTLKSGTSLKEDILNESNGVPYIKVSDMNLVGNEKYIVRANSYVDESISEKMLFPKGTVLFPKRGGAIGTNKKRIASKAVCADLNTMGVIPSDKIRPLYLYYFFQNIDFGTLYNGSSVPQINNTDIAPMEINLIPLEEQDNIVALLEKTDDIVRKRKEELSALDDLIKARFVELFGNPVLNDKGWEQKFLGEITSKIGSGATPKGGKEAYQEDGITLIRSMNVHNGQFEYKDLAHISDEQAAKLDNVTIEKNDVLLNITGASVARSCVVPNEILPARVNQHVCIIRCMDCIIPEFLNKLLIDDNYQDLLWSIAGSGATREAITKQQVENLQIILPPLELQNQFADFVHQVDKSKSIDTNIIPKGGFLQWKLIFHFLKKRGNMIYSQMHA